MEKGYRGYIASRQVYGQYYPQRIQNLVIRDYAQRNELKMLLSITEYAMEESFLMFQQLPEELGKVDGFIFFSLFMLPSEQSLREPFFAQLFKSGAVCHFARENYAIRSREDLDQLNDILLLAPNIQFWEDPKV